MAKGRDVKVSMGGITSETVQRSRIPLSKPIKLTINASYLNTIPNRGTYS